MSAQLKLATDIPKTRDASGDVNGKIGDHIFKTDSGKWNVHDNTIEVYLIDKHDDGSVAEEVFIQFSSDVEHNKELKLQPQRSPLAWVSFKASKPPRVVQCIEATLFIETLSLSPFEVKGQLRGTTDEADQPVDISFHLKQ
ncbi:hypothetical protein AO391_03985 [Pseudomonas marginalis ICMP 9505]|uniref:Uncharacterized protein n=1 Tax=Pseudomonas kitaguniensis TaxID=2607908 RepID=A0A5N7JYY8_9PSED|nr:hypothetical protein [Pseudomonas kitaguniensis]KTC18717.1 hypothetical protein AO391_03985 [Pseudomonas marginalis ICMP 9505]MPQ86618.1 hypothetical protein [Pseudomonas kitaguniensis]MPR02287.1 hypothetical protein [Pseudomonas kitaguniensis]